MNILFKIYQPILVCTLIILIFIISFFFYFQFDRQEIVNNIEYKADVDIINPRFTKEKSNKENLEVIAKKASFLSKNKMFLEGNVKFKSNDFILESDMVNFNQLSFNASSNQKTFFKSKKLEINSNGFQVTNKGDIINFKGKSSITIK